MKTAETIILRPLLTEKLSDAQEKENWFGFKVARDANKIEIRKSIEEKFDVRVTKVQTIVVKGKSKRMNTKRGMTFGKRATWKKALVRLQEGDSIDFVEGIG